MFQTEYFVKKFIGAACLPHTEPWGLCPVLHSRGHNGVHLGGGPKLKVTLHFIVSTRQAWVTWDAIYVYLVHSSGSSRDSFCLAPMGLTTEGITTAEEATDWGQTSLDVLKLIKKPTSVTSQAMLPVANHCPVGHTSQRLHSLQVSHWRWHFNWIVTSRLNHVHTIPSASCEPQNACSHSHHPLLTVVRREPYRWCGHFFPLDTRKF